MTVSIRRMSLGSGYRYLLQSVAVGDGRRDRSSPLTRYYAESGTPPGRFLGAGLADLDGGRGVDVGTPVTEEHLFRLLGMCADPVSGAPLGRRPVGERRSLAERVATRVRALESTMSGDERIAVVACIEAEERARERRVMRPVAGFDLTFSVPKSISIAWALGDEATRRAIYDCHEDAVARALSYAEREFLRSRSGVGGIVEEEVSGVVATAFDHWDSRAGDPQLHTHVVVANRARSVADGTWRTLDSRQLFKSVVALSELHQGILQDLLADGLGWRFDARERAHSEVAKYEVAGVSDALIAEFSTRSAAIEDAKEVLVARFVATNGRAPSSDEVLRLRQQATLSTRPEKSHRSLEEMVPGWRVRAGAHLEADPESFIASLGGGERDDPRRDESFSHREVAELASRVLSAVAERRATFSRANLLAETHRQLHEARFVAPEARLAVAERAVDRAVGGAVVVDAPELCHVPQAFRRADGSSKFRSRGQARYTTALLLEAEARLLEAARDRTGPVVPRGVVASSVSGVHLDANPRLGLDQALAVEAIATSGRVLDVLVGPAGSGKTTTLAALRRVWEAEHGRGSVIGLAPSAAAASALADELAIATENTAKWLVEQRRESERDRQLRELRDELARLPPYHPRRSHLAVRAASIETELERWRVRATELLLVDEATLAGTLALDEVVTGARRAGAKVVVVGDVAQLSAIDAGGAFAMLVGDRDPAPELSDVHRFAAPWERSASLQLRAGDRAAIDAYVANARVAGGGREEMLDALFAAWRADVAKGRSSLMVAGDAESVGALNARARAGRVAAGEVAAFGVQVAGSAGSAHGAALDKAVAGVGDRIVTRENSRQLTASGRWVRNGDEWVVVATSDDGSMTVRRAGDGGVLVLPATYVREHVELAYATTVYRAQGATVDTAHALVGTSATREVLYVAATRGRLGNWLYVDLASDVDPDTAHGERDERSTLDVLDAVLANSGAEEAATVAIARARETAASRERVDAEYQTIARVAMAPHWDGLLGRAGLGVALDAVHVSPAYGALTAALSEAGACGLDVEAALPLLARGRSFDDADDIAAVLHGRVDRWIAASGARRRRPPRGSVREVGPVPRAVADPDLARALSERAAAMGAPM